VAAALSSRNAPAASEPRHRDAAQGVGAPTGIFDSCLALEQAHIERRRCALSRDPWHSFTNFWEARAL